MSTDITVIDSNSVNKSLSVYENQFLGFVNSMGLPTDNILVTIDERKKVIKNFEDVVELLSDEDRGKAKYVSKFLAAASAGLFDAALNYLWDETVQQLRSRVANYDVEYFYDVALGTNTEKRKKLSGVESLSKLDDSELIKGAKDIDMISDVGYQHLDYIKYMRNWASAAHPNQTEITGLQLISWMETCIKEVINLPNSMITIETGRFLKNIKENPLSREQVNAFTSFVSNLTQEKSNNLASGLFGIYTRLDTEQFARENVRQVFPVVWERLSEEMKNEMGIKYARLAVNGGGDEERFARELLQLVNGQAYFPDQIRTPEIDNAIDFLIKAHEGINNFYNEPSFAMQLQRVVGDKPIPVQLNVKYVRCLVYCFITNGNGVCWDADPIYKELIEKMDQKQISIAVCTFMNERISSMLQLKLCEQKYRELMNILKQKNASPAVAEIISIFEDYPAKLDTMRRDSKIKSQMETYRVLLKQ